ncbi:hypothetical protein ColLi_13665 [Colletotrichum liriopes]|uniref:Alcohol dehydrogenase-like C-terminal domain-containing protein n=1 Tax=Colletotrichum liriopes TaxID=708192 RepID=A0AA37H2R8_9PEZI|nr:hypothetical protein ColLi_13665 [Colletotrichum liriopes]
MPRKQLSGSFQEYLTVPADSLILIPDHLIKRVPDAAALCGALCSGSAGLMAIRAVKIRAQDVVVVVGVGGAIGQYATSIARNVYGAKVIGINMGSKVAAMEKDGYSEYVDVLLPAPADNASPDSWDLFVRSILECCTHLRPDKSIKRAADALIVAASSAAAFRNLEDYVCDGGWIVCSGRAGFLMGYGSPCPYMMLLSGTSMLQAR